MKIKNHWIMAAGISGFLAVSLGAFGAHGLKAIISPAMLETYKTGVLYHLVHTIGILAIALSGNSKYYKAAFFFSAGIILFSFSLYLYSISGISWLAMITPIGGISFLIGWLQIIFQSLKKEN